MLITIHRNAFQDMIGGNADVNAGADFVRASSGSIFSRTLRKIMPAGRASNDPSSPANAPGSRTQPIATSPSSPSSTSTAPSSLVRSTSSSGMKRQGTFTLKGNFSASQASRTSVSYSPDEIAPQKLLLERAITARATMKAWCDLRGITPMAFVTMPLPEPLQELQVRTRCSWVGSVNSRTC